MSPVPEKVLPNFSKNNVTNKISLPLNLKGLSNEEVIESRLKSGGNALDHKKESGFFGALKNLLKEPMFLLLLAAATIYFITEKYADGLFMLLAIAFVGAISLFQDVRSRNALEALNTLTQPTCKVIRNNTVEEINIEEIVLGDYMIVEEGTSIPADGSIIQSNDFTVNESILTGESFSLNKSEKENENLVYRGTTVTTGLAVCKVTNIGNNTRLGQIGKSLETIIEEDTPLQIQIRSFVKKMAFAGSIVFIIVWAINYSRSLNVLDSLLKALTLAMSIVPEEIPVAFTTFMALGAWRLMKIGVIVKQTKTVEALGSATVICIDKTGTITQNKMLLTKLFTLSTNKITVVNDSLSENEKDLIQFAMWSSEPIPFDPMEKALHDAYSKFAFKDERPHYKMIHEYPLDGQPPMMTHVFEDASGNRKLAAKGAPEALMKVSGLSETEEIMTSNALNEIAAEGYRILGVGVADFDGNDFPEKQQQIKFRFLGLVAFYDPPKENINSVFEAFFNAGIKMKIVTGDIKITTATIAKQVGFRGSEFVCNGDDLMSLNEKDLAKKVETTTIFTRMFPESKLKIINALKANGHVVAMTGDGVNDGPALKAAHIGIAMGIKGSEIAKQASSLILVDDNLEKMVDAIAMGRKIYANLKKAIQYIISIHIPIILTVFIPLAMGWIYPNIFSPVHIIFLEMIMGPTCSIIYENEPMEKNLMIQKPRQFTNTFFNLNELTTSIVQGLVITCGTLFIYQYAARNGYSEYHTRTMVFAVLISANIVLTLVNRSFYYSIATTIMYKNNLVPIIIGLTILICGLLFYVPAFTRFFQFELISAMQLFFCAAIGFVSVIWFELIKWFKRRTTISESKNP